MSLVHFPNHKISNAVVYRYSTVHAAHLLEGIEDGETLHIECEGKAGFDGSAGHFMYNQKFSQENRDTSDSSLLATCYMLCAAPVPAMKP